MCCKGIHIPSSESTHWIITEKFFLQLNVQNLCSVECTECKCIGKCLQNYFSTDCIQH